MTLGGEQVGEYLWHKKATNCKLAPTKPPRLDQQGQRDLRFSIFDHGILACQLGQAVDGPCFHWMSGEDTWNETMVPPLPAVFYEGNMVSNGKDVLLMGSDKVALLLNRRWEIVAQQPRGRVMYMTLVWIDGWGVLCIGGQKPKSQPRDDVHLFDVRNRTWQKKANFVDRVNVVSCGDVLFRDERSVLCAHGEGVKYSTALVAVYNIGNDTWTRLKDKSGNKIRNSATFLLGSKLHFLGGMKGRNKSKQNVDTVEYFDLVKEQWVGNVTDPYLAFPTSGGKVVVLAYKFWEIN